jgi:hypothetical protein
VRQVAGWLTRHPATLTEDDQVRLKAVLEQCPELRSAAGHVRAFGEMLTKLRGQELPAWIAAVRAEGLPGLTAFADSLTSDLDAVTRGLTTRSNSGPIEGRVNHIKMLKRQMFGRASLPLLRASPAHRQPLRAYGPKPPAYERRRRPRPGAAAVCSRLGAVAQVHHAVAEPALVHQFELKPDPVGEEVLTARWGSGIPRTARDPS